MLGTTRIVREVPEYRGVFELDTRSTVAQCILFGGFESSFVRLFETVIAPGQDLLDVGANVGLYTVLGGKLVGQGRVLSVEPVPSVLSLLRANIAKNGLKNVEVFEGVATDKAGPCSITSIEGNEEFSSIGGITHPTAPLQARKSIEIQGETLDNLVAARGLQPGVMKVDVEGAEAFAFRGAKNILEKFRPIIMSELDARLMTNPGESPELVRALLTEQGYRIFDIMTGKDLSDGNPLVDYVGEIVGIPSEKCS